MTSLARLLPALCIALAFAPVKARACVPPPPPPMNDGESQAAYDQRVDKWRADSARAEADEWDKRVRGFWDSADAVVLVRVDRSVSLNEGGYRLRLTGLKWIKGAKGRRTFEIYSPPPPPCGAIDLAAKGDRVVLYLPAKGAGLGGPFWIRPKNIRDARVTAMLPATDK